MIVLYNPYIKLSSLSEIVGLMLKRQWDSKYTRYMKFIWNIYPIFKDKTYTKSC